MRNGYRKIGLRFFFAVVFLLLVLHPEANALENEDLPQIIQKMKIDPRGPYKSINWYCPDGEVLPAQKPCAEPGGIQHATLKDKIKDLEKTKSIYLDLVLAGSSYDEIWDSERLHKRLKQYSILQFLIAVDEGWIYRKAAYYRGAIQGEDEASWGDGFLNQWLNDEAAVKQEYFQLREACKNIPHAANENRIGTIRSASKTLSDKIPEFMDLRVKLHGRPDSDDAKRVKAFLDKNAALIDEENRTLLNQLISDLEFVFSDSGKDIISKLITKNIAKIPAISKELNQFLQDRPLLPKNKVSLSSHEPNPFESISDLLLKIRTRFEEMKPAHRLKLMDLSIELERLLFRTIGNWEPATVGELINKSRVLLKAATGCGYIELWEWYAADETCCKNSPGQPVLFEDFKLKIHQMRQMVDWGSSMIRSAYSSEVQLYSTFEPLANGFVDDCVRSSILLASGETIGHLVRLVQDRSVMPNLIPVNLNIGGIRAINPGLAYGVLEVVEDHTGTLVFDPKKIYVFKYFPPELKPVAGIFAMSEGNLVSHVQLLARNLGIPNAVISSDTFNALKSMSGQKVFYAVSQNGVIVLKPDEQLTPEERVLVEGKKRSEERIRVPTEKIKLDQLELIPLSKLRAEDSGKICGPKAANLGQLKYLFPDYVGEGLVIPFGIFRRHLDQPMPGMEMTYWQFLTASLSTQGETETPDETQLLDALTKLHKTVKSIPFLPEFEENLANTFNTTFGVPLGDLPVFIRSDTNMEDLKDFTGAGLNLTVFNVRDREKIYQGIRDVWASPYSERSYKWRQKYLMNPENVFPSILLLPSINVDKSGVVITRGIVSGKANDISVAFNRGVGGAVEGQTSESYLLRDTGADMLLSASREQFYTRLPENGGTEKYHVFLNQPILSEKNRLDIRNLTNRVYELFPVAPGSTGHGPFDIELGFLDDGIRLFQVRPFVENKSAASMAYLLDLDARISIPVEIHMEDQL